MKYLISRSPHRSLTVTAQPDVLLRSDFLDWSILAEFYGTYPQVRTAEL
jgi:hypothetical protein